MIAIKAVIKPMGPGPLPTQLISFRKTNGIKPHRYSGIKQRVRGQHKIPPKQYPTIPIPEHAKIIHAPNQGIISKNPRPLKTNQTNPQMTPETIVANPPRRTTTTPARKCKVSPEHDKTVTAGTVTTEHIPVKQKG
jgi:hypothetical protein